MKQRAFTETAYRRMVRDINKNRKHYEQRGNWLSDAKKHAEFFQDTAIIIPKKVSLRVPDDKNSFDYENARSIHQQLSGLTPVLASDPRLWARLAHVECWNYMQRRWPVDDAKSAKIIRPRYFFAGTDSRALLRNGISRLWWSAEMTHEEKRKGNKYELTEVILSRLDIAQQLLERSFGRVKPLVQGFLEFVLKHRDKCLDAGGRSRNRVRYLAACLHAKSGVCVLDTISKKQLSEFLADELTRYDKRS